MIVIEECKNPGRIVISDYQLNGSVLPLGNYQIRCTYSWLIAGHYEDHNSILLRGVIDVKQ